MQVKLTAVAYVDDTTRLCTFVKAGSPAGTSNPGVQLLVDDPALLPELDVGSLYEMTLNYTITPA